MIEGIIDFAIRRVAPDHLCDFHIDEMRSVKRAARGEQPIFHVPSRRRAEKRFEHG